MTALLSPNVAGFLAARLSHLGLPVVSLVRNQTTAELQAMPAWRRCLIRPMLRAAYRHVDAIGCVARPVSKDLIARFDLEAGKVFETFNPVILPDANTLTERPSYFPTDAPVILAIGRLVPQKDYATVLRAFARYRAAGQGHLVVLGEGPLQGDLEVLAEQLGIHHNVTWAGFESAPHAALAHADLFVLLSKFEGFPNVIGEALACGSRIVATNAPGGTADVLADGTYGELVPVGDVAAAAKAMMRALAEPAQPERQIGRAREFSIEAIAQHYLELCAFAVQRRGAE
jgi:glycosyltransferase involved in cell wall biosynthesis